MEELISMLHRFDYTYKKYKIPLICIVILIVFWILYSFEECSKTDVHTSLTQNPYEELYKNAEKRITYLTTVLKQHKVSEQFYLPEKNLPKIFVITPTYKRPLQKAELTRLKNVFVQVPRIHWIVIEDSSSYTQLVTNFLDLSGIPFTHLFKATPTRWKLTDKDPHWRKPRGVLQRNAGLDWVLNQHTDEDGVVYFADDDNTYSTELFKEMRWTTRVSAWPVGLVGGVMVERPSLDVSGRVNGWITGWRPDRAFAIDMAGFSVSLHLLRNKPDVRFSHKSNRGFLESDFLEQLVSKADVEPKANKCSEVYVWHTQTIKPNLVDEEKLKKKGKATNNNIEV